ncbi:SulP family inorganic anion transporter [Actinocatenispora rupis]|uniref:Sodium-independent anion transporter n=1 Tax=Actinocatenispora rupis TaxID=519421 RepID=A0A8J3JDY3_9ACTN|nr:SulP family inorganic anion transporter [Actinocatenispora rupis]GID13053.1 sodium-independent anion transporter [Actinocatenispora rupis]
MDWLRGYRRAWLRPDVLASLTIWALVVPQAIAYAQIAGLPPQSGLFAAIAGLLAYAVLGSCRQMVVSPTSSTAAISAALVAPAAAGDARSFAGLSAVLAMLVGATLIGLAALKMGFVSRFIAAGVQTGFMFGLGLTIIVGQVPKLLGVPDSGGNFVPKLGHLVGHLGDVHPVTAAVGLGALAVLLVLRRFVPLAPAALIVVVAGVLAVAFGHLDHHGVAVLGRVDGAVPVPAVPHVPFDAVVTLVPGAMAIAVVGYAETATVGEAMADRHGEDVRPNRELTAVGAGNILAGFLQGFIVGGGASQTAANDRAGARTPLVSLVVAGLTVLTAVALLPLFRDLPQAVLGAIVISAVLGFLNVAALRRIARLRRDSFVIALAAMAGVLVLGVLPGLLTAVSASILLLLSRIARPTVGPLGRVRGTAIWVRADAPTPDLVTEPGLLVYRLNAALVFANAKLLRDGVRSAVAAADPPVRVVLVDMSLSTDLDVETVNVLDKLVTDLAASGARLWLGGVHTPARAVLDRSGLTARIGADHLYPSVGAGAGAYPGAVSREP